MPKAPVSAAQLGRYFELRGQGLSQREAAAKAGFSESTAHKYELKMAAGRLPPLPSVGVTREFLRGQAAVPFALDALCPAAQKGLVDFEFFRRFYLGHISTPWQVETAVRLVGLISTPQKEFVVENCPPGVGKTTLIHDLACWMTVKDRRLRGLIGSRTETNARRMLSRVKRSLERPSPARASTELAEKGLATDAMASLAQHYGNFRPTGDVWRADEFVVAQHDDIPIEEKEPTWSSYGLDSGVLSNRFNLIFWDDLIDSRTNRTSESREALAAKWDEELESRLEPGGLLVVLGQRLHREDLYATLRDRRMTDDGGDEVGPMYHHVTYQAHDESRCEKVHHPKEAEPWPDGCLLDPYRLPWSECRKLMSKRHIWPVVYQQTDGDQSAGLVHPVWIAGGAGPDGTDHPGCWDEDRGMAELPPLEGRILSVATVDPSPTKFWAVQWWVYHPASEFRFLLDLERKQMESPDFFDFNPITGQAHGLMVDWQERSQRKGWPITHWIVERNAAQRFMLQQTSLKQYAAKQGFSLLPHETTMNKSDPRFGVQSIASHYEFGRVRLPGRWNDLGRTKALRLVDELLRWPEGSTDDCVMAHWFFEWNLRKLTVTDLAGMPRPKRPSWWKTKVAV